MNRFVAPVIACFVATAAGLVVAADLKSGMDIGESTTPFNVRDITGPNKGKTLCYRCQYGAKPVACVFTREITPAVAALVKQIDATVDANKEKKMSAFVVLLSEDADAAAKQLEKLAADQKISSTPLTVFDGTAGPAEYKIAKDAAVTVMMWNKGRVAVNHAFPSAKLSDEQVKAVAGDTSKILN